jgi:hypothetical protein
MSTLSLKEQDQIDLLTKSVFAKYKCRGCRSGLTFNDKVYCDDCQRPICSDCSIRVPNGPMQESEYYCLICSKRRGLGNSPR